MKSEAVKILRLMELGWTQGHLAAESKRSAKVLQCEMCKRGFGGGIYRTIAQSTDKHRLVVVCPTCNIRLDAIA